MLGIVNLSLDGCLEYLSEARTGYLGCTDAEGVRCASGKEAALAPSSCLLQLGYLGAATRVVLDLCLDRCLEYLGGAKTGVEGTSYARVKVVVSAPSSYSSLPAIRRRDDHHILRPSLFRCLEYPGEAVGEERRRRR